MKELFTYLCDFSIVTSIAILLAVLLRPLLKKGPSFVRCILWALVFLRLLVPVGMIKVPFGTVSLFDNAEQAVSAPYEEDTPAEGVSPDGNTVQKPVQTPTGQNPGVQPSVPQAPTVQPPVSGTTPGSGGTVSAPAIEENTSQAEQLPQGETLQQGESGIDVPFVLSVVWAVGVIAMLGYMLASNLLLRHRVRNAIVYDSRIRV
ncbi:MAG: hypothetical protein J1E00_09915, partial [Oscillospiraceae bacterium]|nr:hypothetical protein [Oscillospiraceae bacterium]